VLTPRWRSVRRPSGTQGDSSCAVLVSRHAVQSPPGTALGALQRLARTRAAQKVLARPRAQRFVSVCLEAMVLRKPALFVARELSGRTELARYELRSSRRPIYLRHNTADRFVLHEVFYEGHYELPEPVHAFLTTLGRPPEIVDLGANIGLFSVLMAARFPNARITAFEPDETNAAVFRRTMAENDLGRSWRLVAAAASNRAGRVPFVSGEYSRSRIGPGGAGADVEAVDVFPDLERADFAKIDIEGGEWAILQDERFAVLETPVLVLEYHADLFDTGDPRESALAAVTRAGYHYRPTWEFPGQGMLWAWKPEVERHG
jgi:FkbM family methyltransferase